MGIVVARTIRRLPASEREDSSLVVAMRGTPVAGRPADAAAGDAPTVTRHAVEHGEVVVVLASSGAQLQAGSGEGVSAPSNPVPNLPKPTVARAQPSSAAVESSHHPSEERVDSSGPGGDVPVEVAQVVEPPTKSHAPVRSTMRASFQRDREGDPRRAVGQVRDLPNAQLVVQAATDAATDICCNVNRNVLNWVSLHQAVYVTFGVMSLWKRPPPPPPAEPPPVLRTSDETDAMTLAAVHPCHEEPVEISRTEFESFVRDGFYFEEDTLEELHLDEVVEAVNST